MTGEAGDATTRVYLGLGGNLGDPRAAMASALQMLGTAEGVAVARVSPLYRTPPWGRTDQPDFLNAAAALDTTLAPRRLLELCLKTEKALKRRRDQRWGPRLIDLDILVFGDRSVSEQGLEIPHPHMLERAFVIVPLARIAPHLVLAGRTAAERAAGLDSGGITIVTAGEDWWRERSG